MKAPTDAQIAASIGCEQTQLIRTELNVRKTDLRLDHRKVYTSFVDQGDPEHAAVFETLWPQ